MSCPIGQHRRGPVSRPSTRLHSPTLQYRTKGECYDVLWWALLGEKHTTRYRHEKVEGEPQAGRGEKGGGWESMTAAAEEGNESAFIDGAYQV